MLNWQFCEQGILEECGILGWSVTHIVSVEGTGNGKSTSEMALSVIHVVSRCFFVSLLFHLSESHATPFYPQHCGLKEDRLSHMTADLPWVNILRSSILKEEK